MVPPVTRHPSRVSLKFPSDRPFQKGCKKCFFENFSKKNPTTVQQTGVFLMELGLTLDFGAAGARPWTGPTVVPLCTKDRRWRQTLTRALARADGNVTAWEEKTTPPLPPLCFKGGWGVCCSLPLPPTTCLCHRHGVTCYPSHVTASPFTCPGITPSPVTGPPDGLNFRKKYFSKFFSKNFLVSVAVFCCGCGGESQPQGGVQSPRAVLPIMTHSMAWM